MSTEEPTPQPSNRTPWIIAGVLGCFVLCLVIAIAGGALYFFVQPATTISGPVATATPLPPLPTLPPVSSPVPPPPPTETRAPAQPTSTTAPSPVAPTALPTLAPLPPSGLPTLPPLVQPTSQATARPTAAAANFLIAFSKDEGPQPEAKSVWIMNGDGTGAQKLVDRASHPILSRDGNQIAFYHWTDGIYLVNASDPKNITVKKLVGDTFTGGNYGSGDWSHNGRWIAYTRQPGGQGNIVVDVIAPDGTGQRTVAIGESPTWSPDDTMLAFHTCRGSACGIYKGSINGGDAIPIITDDGGLPAWSPDGKRIIYQKEVDGQKQLFLINPDGTGKKQLTSGAAMHVDAQWSPDGAHIYYRSPQGGTWGIWRMNSDGTGAAKLIDNVAPVNWPYERLSISR